MPGELTAESEALLAYYDEHDGLPDWQREDVTKLLTAIENAARADSEALRERVAALEAALTDTREAASKVWGPTRSNPADPYDTLVDIEDIIRAALARDTATGAEGRCAFQHAWGDCEGERGFWRHDRATAEEAGDLYHPYQPPTRCAAHGQDHSNGCP